MLKNQRVFRLLKDFPPDVRTGSICMNREGSSQYIWQESGDPVIGNPESLPKFFTELKFTKPQFEIGDVVRAKNGASFSGYDSKNKHYSFGKGQLFKVVDSSLKTKNVYEARIILTLLPIRGNQVRIDKVESDLEHVQLYYFINSSGEISSDVITDSSNEKKKKAFEFRKKVNNVFYTADEARFELKKLLK